MIDRPSRRHVRFTTRHGFEQFVKRRTVFATLGSGNPASSKTCTTDQPWRLVTRAAAHFVDKILRGVSPSEIPVEINLKTVKALGITFQIS
jgi:hypothetical protein